MINIGKTEIVYNKISIEEFLKYDLYDDEINGTGKLFVFNEKYTNQIHDKLIDDWMLSKEFRFEDTVRQNRMFFVDNMDIQSIDSEIDLLHYLHYDIKEVIYIVDEDGEI